MRRRIPVIHFVLITLLAMPTFTWSRATEEPNQGWAVLKAVQPGETLHVKLKDGKRIKGMLNSVSETRLIVTDEDQTTGFDRGDILEIRLSRGRSLKKPILTGAAIGAGAGIGLGGIAAASDNDGQWFDVKASDAVPIGAAVGAIVGTIIGLTIGLFPRRGDLIYKAEQE